VIDETTDTGRALKKLVDLNHMAYSELILSMDIKKPGGLVAFGIEKIVSQMTMKTETAA
jgi:hypothetical protein